MTFSISGHMLHFWWETCMHCQVKAAWRSSCHHLCCLSIRREFQRSMISLSFRGAILLTRRRSAKEVNVNKIDRPNTTPTVRAICSFAIYFVWFGLVSFHLVWFWLVSFYLVSFWLVSFHFVSFYLVSFWLVLFGLVSQTSFQKFQNFWWNGKSRVFHFIGN